MWDRNESSAIKAVQAPESPIVETARQYAQTCEHFERMQAEFHKLNEELKRIDNARKELREQLLRLVKD